MILKIIASTDNRFLGLQIDSVFPVMLGPDFLFDPDVGPIRIDNTIDRYFNSNYSIDTIQV